MGAKDITGPFIQGQKDCAEGLPQRSNDPDYIRGYGYQYDLEQCQAWWTEKAMEKAHGN